MLKFLIIFGAFIHVCLLKVIDSNNCINGARFTTKCGYKINFTNIGFKSLHCILKFTLSNPTVKFNNYFIRVKRQTGNQCPLIDLNITNIVDGKAKVNELFSTCGGEIEKLEHKFSNFSLFVLKLDTKGLNDQDSMADMSLVIDGDCSERKNIIWIIMILIIIIVIGSAVFYRCRKQKYRDLDRNEMKKRNVIYREEERENLVDISLEIDGYCKQNERIETRNNFVWIIIFISVSILLIKKTTKNRLIKNIFIFIVNVIVLHRRKQEYGVVVKYATKNREEF